MKEEEIDFEEPIDDGAESDAEKYKRTQKDWEEWYAAYEKEYRNP